MTALAEDLTFPVQGNSDRSEANLRACPQFAWFGL